MLVRFLTVVGAPIVVGWRGKSWTTEFTVTVVIGEYFMNPTWRRVP